MTLWQSALVVVGALGLSVGGGWWVVPLLLRAAARSTDAGPVSASAPDGSETDPARVLRGGTWIGALERAAVTAALLAGYPAGIAFVIAVKGLGRYPELREHPGSSERFVIGTLASLGWSTGVGLLGAALLGTHVVGA
jgi:hypothetical protein